MSHDMTTYLLYVCRLPRVLLLLLLLLSYTYDTVESKFSLSLCLFVSLSLCLSVSLSLSLCLSVSLSLSLSLSLSTMTQSTYTSMKFAEEPGPGADRRLCSVIMLCKHPRACEGRKSPLAPQEGGGGVTASA